MAKNDEQEIIEKLHAAAAELERTQAEGIARSAAAVSPPTLRESTAAARNKTRGYHDEVRDGKRTRHRATTRGDRERAAQQAREGDGHDDAAA